MLGHPKPRVNYVSENGTHHSVTDGVGNFSFNFTVSANMTGYNRAVLLVTCWNKYVTLSIPWEEHQGSDFHEVTFPRDLNNSIINFDPNLPGINQTRNIIVSDIVMGASIGTFEYAGRLANALGVNPSNIAVHKTNGGYSGQFDCSSLLGIQLSREISISKIHTPGNQNLTTPAHEYGHYVHYTLWGSKCSDWYNSSEQTKESFAMFYSYATRHYAYKNGFGLKPLPGMEFNDALILTVFNNFDIAGFTDPRFTTYFSYPAHARWATYLWNLYDGNPSYTFHKQGSITHGGQTINYNTLTDNDDIAMPTRVIQAFGAIRDITNFPNNFKTRSPVLSAAEQSSVDAIYNNMMSTAATPPPMRSGNFATTSIGTLNSLTVNITYQPFNFPNPDNFVTCNPPTGFRVFYRKFTNCPWGYLGDIPYVTGQVNYSKTFNVGVNPALYNYRLAVINASGESLPQIFYTHYNSGTCQSIEGPSTVCNNDSFFLLDAPAGTITWTVNGSFKPTTGTGHSFTISKTGASNTWGTVKAFVNGVEVANKFVTGCVTEISGSNIIGAEGSNYSLNTGESVSWSVSSGFTRAPVSGVSTKVTPTSVNGQSGTLTATLSDGATVTKNISAYPALGGPILGPDKICNTGPGVTYTLASGQAMGWATAGPFSIVSSNATSAVVKATAANGSGAIIATFGASGAVNKPVVASCSKGSNNDPENDFDLDIYVSVYPNPASNHLYIEIDAEAQLQDFQSRNIGSVPVYDVRLYDLKGILQRQQKTNGGSVHFNVAQLPYGIYFLIIYDGVSDKPLIKQILVDHSTKISKKKIKKGLENNKNLLVTVMYSKKIQF